MIHEYADGTAAIASHGMWLPGIYADRRAARWAFTFSDETLAALALAGRPITTADLRAARTREAVSA